MPVAPPTRKPRPVYLDLTSIRQPLPAVVSILHRISGALLFAFGIPLLLCTVATSVASAEAYARFKGLIGSPLAKLVLLVLAWAYLHHLFAGIRHLFADAHVGVDLPSARRSAAIALVLALVCTIALAARLW
ncbi:MAG: succinate dehydrogenase, cytochrome b556 subunit [Proteobacteria bacterium]|nr:succinate dehydrogenase, cytochrome b556 subunit [Pseudomonadota bacterium]